MVSIVKNLRECSRLTKIIGSGCLFAFIVMPTCAAQGTTGQNATGTKPFWTYLTDREVISPSSGNLMITIPMLHLPGRDGHDLNVSMVYNSQSDLALTGIIQPPNGPNMGPEGTMLYTGGTVHWGWNDPTISPQNAQFDSVNYNSIECQGNYIVHTSGSATYTFGAVNTGCQTVGPGGSTPLSGATIPVATDDSRQGVILDALAPTGPTAYFPDGKRLISIPHGALDVDANGNYITYNYSAFYYQGESPLSTTITDTVGRTVSMTTNKSGQQLLQYYNSEGTLQTITVTYGGAPTAPTAALIYLPAPDRISETCQAYNYCYSPSGFNNAQFQISSIVFPDGSSYSFAYDAMGDLTKIGYPGGGYTRYDFNILAPHLYYVRSLTTSNSYLQAGVSPQVSAKYTCPDTGISYGTKIITAGNTCSVPEQVTTYAPTTLGGAYNTGNTVTEPDGTTTAYTFNYVYNSQAFPGAPTGMLAEVHDFTPVELAHTITSADGTVLEQVTNTYESDAMHLHSRTTARLHGLSTLESWTNATTSLYYGGPLVNGATYPNAESSWTVTSLETDDLISGNMINRKDYTWYSPSFDPTMPYFDALKLTDSLYDPAKGGYTLQTENQYDANSIVSSQVASSPTYSASVQHLTQTGTARGNLTASLQWSDSDKAWIGGQRYFDDAGNIVKTTDARGYATTYGYTDSWANSGCLVIGAGQTAAYQTSIKNTLSQSVSTIYNPCTGTVASRTDANSQTTSYTYWPATEQLASVSSPDGGFTSYCYENTAPCTGVDSAATNYTVATHTMDPDPAVVNEQDFDGLGRTIASKVMSDPWCSNNGTETFYNSREWVSKTTFPHCSGVTGASTTFLYNGLGYPTSKQVTGSVARTLSYSGQSVTETDEVGNVTTSTVDSLGRLSQVMEPGPNNTALYETDYQYDAANSLTQVDQWGGSNGSVGDRQRVFTYDTLERLHFSYNPEAGGITYVYDTDSNLVSVTDARNITTSRTFDHINRLVQTNYSDGTPTDCYVYDTPFGEVSTANPIGRLVAEWTQTQTNCPEAGLPAASVLMTERFIGSANGNGGYDQMGRLTADLQCPSMPCTTLYPSHYTYNAGGMMRTQMLSGLPNGNLTLAHSYDAAARTSVVTSSWIDPMHPGALFEADTNTNSALGTPYGPFGLLNAAYGVGSSNFTHATTSRTYDTHGRSQSETDYGAALSAGAPATVAMGTIDIAMNEQYNTGLNTPSMAQITITSPFGGDQSSTSCNCSDTGLIGIGLGGSGGGAETVQDGPTSTTAGLAASLADAFNNDCNSAVTAVASDSTITLIAKKTGAMTDYPLSIIAASTNPNFPLPSFLPVASTATMIGGQSGNGMPVYDSGTVQVTIGSLPQLSLAWNSNDSAATIANRLAALINQTPVYSSVLRASPNGTRVVLEAINAGKAGSLGVTTSVTYNNSAFASSSVALSASPLVGGVDSVSPHGAVLAYQYNNATWQDNGSLGSVTDTVFGSQTFSYDTLNRLKGDTIVGASGTGKLSWSYDPFGNRLSQSATGSLGFGVTQMTASYNGNALLNGAVQTGVYANRMDGTNHDGSGNVLSDSVGGQNFYSYDAASRLRTAGSVCYVYNAEGIRTAKGSWSGGQCTNITAQYLLGQGGEQVTELDGLGVNATWAHTNVFGAGKLLATYDNVGLHFHFTDWLGTNRVQMSADGTVEETCLSLPFGDSLRCSGPGTDATEHHFTGKERDQESGLDYFGARYFQSNTGRWMSPDWAAKAMPIPYAKMDWPQSFNLYGYVDNNPLSMADQDGHQSIGDCALGADACRKRDKERAESDRKAREEAERKAKEKAQQKGGLWASVTGAMAGGIARVSPAAARKLWEAANPGKAVPFDSVRGRFQDMAHIRALADGGTNAAENLKPQDHGDHMDEHVSNGDFIRWGSRAKNAVVDVFKAVDRQTESDISNVAQAVKEGATEVIEHPVETIKDVGVATEEAVQNGEIPPI